MKVCGRKVRWLTRPAIEGALLLLLTSFLRLGEGQDPFFPAACGALFAVNTNIWFSAAGALLTGQYALWTGFAVCALLARPLRALSEESRACVLAFLSQIPQGLLMGRPWMEILICAAIACALSPALVTGLRVRRDRRVLSPEEKLSVTLRAMMALWGLARLSPFPAQVLCVLWAAAAAREGAAAGALAGLLGGLCCCSGTAFALSAALGGGAAGALRDLKRIPACIGMLFAMTLCGLWLGARDPLSLIAAAMGLLAAAVLPERHLRPLYALARPFAGQGEAFRLKRARRRVGDMRRAIDVCVADCLREAPPEDRTEEAAYMRDRLCRGCADYAACWDGSDPRAGRLFSYLLARMDEGHALPPDTTPDQVRFCRRAPLMRLRLAGVFSAARARKLSRARLRAAARMTAEPLKKVADLLGGLERDLSRMPQEDEYGTQCLSAALDEAGLPDGAALSCDGAAELASAPVSGDTIKQIAALFSKALGGRYVSQSATRYRPRPQIRFRTELCSRQAKADAPCGDMALCADLEDGRTALIVSDGMGRGGCAAAESRRVVTLMHRLLLAGSAPASAIEAVNSMMRLTGGDRFATLDLCILDEDKKEAVFYKMGACLSILLRRGMCLRIEGGRLPPGAAETPDAAVTRLRIRPGDTVIMITDGIADFARPGQEDRLTHRIASLANASPAVMARTLLRDAEVRENGGAADDMTVLCARIEKNGE